LFYRLRALEEFSLAVVGINYPNADRTNRRFELALCVPGEPVRLVLEPDNKHDPAAVAVFSCRNMQIGYLSRERCLWVGSRMRAGEDHQVIFQDVDEYTASVRVRFGGGEPTLPMLRPRPVPRDVDEWLYRDPEGGDWGC
jgi:hypothetical protein